MVKRNSFQVPTQTASQGLIKVAKNCVIPYTRLIPKFLFSGRKYSTTKIYIIYESASHANPVTNRENVKK